MASAASDLSLGPQESLRCSLHSRSHALVLMEASWGTSLTASTARARAILSPSLSLPVGLSGFSELAGGNCKLD